MYGFGRESRPADSLAALPPALPLGPPPLSTLFFAPFASRERERIRVESESRIRAMEGGNVLERKDPCERGKEKGKTLRVGWKGRIIASKGTLWIVFRGF